MARDPVAKALMLLRHVIESPRSEASVREVGRNLGLPPSTVHRLFKSLAAAGMLESDPATSQYRPGAELHRLARILTDGFPLPALVQPYLERLSRDTGETSLLSVYDAGRSDMMFVTQVEGSHPLRYVVPLHSWVSPLTGASGQAILAFLAPEALDRALARHDPDDEVDRRRLAETLALIRDRGYALSHGERIAGAVGMAAPVFRSGSPRILGDVLLTVPESRFEPAAEQCLADLVMSSADRVTQVLGGTEPPSETAVERNDDAGPAASIGPGARHG